MQRIIDAVQKNRQLILDAERYIWANPETGFKEFKTNEYMIEKFTQLGYKLDLPKNLTGFCTTIDTGKKGPKLLILGELDSIICPSHPESDKQTGAVHSCGHNAQCAALLGIASALKEPNLLNGLCGQIVLCAVPAEELLEIEYRSSLIKQGKIKYFGGKSEFLSRGLFDGVDIAFMVHTTAGANFSVNLGGVGCMAKSIIYKGTASHAGGSPWLGKNALYAATCGLNACNAIRERFKESDIIRFHPIITSGGAMVNAIPEQATIESYVRGRTFDAIKKANEQLNQALIGSALSLGCNVEILDNPGYAPYENSPDMIELAKDALSQALPLETFDVINQISSGSTDMGDLSCIMPIIHPYAPGAIGNSHGNDYYIKDANRACVKSAIWQLAMIKLLLSNNGERANKIIASYKPLFKNKEEFLAYQDSIFSSGERIIYKDNQAQVILK